MSQLAKINQRISSILVISCPWILFNFCEQEKTAAVQLIPHSSHGVAMPSAILCNTLYRM